MQKYNKILKAYKLILNVLTKVCRTNFAKNSYANCQFEPKNIHQHHRFDINTSTPAKIEVHTNMPSSKSNTSNQLT